MTRGGLVAVAAVVALAALWFVVPALVVRQQVAAMLQAHLRAAGTLSVTARATLPGVVRGRVERLDIVARRARLGDLSVDRFEARLDGVRLRRTTGGAVEIAGVRSGTARTEVTAGDLAVFLQNRGVGNPSVQLDASGVRASGILRTGPIEAEVRASGRFVIGSATDLFVRLTHLEVSGVDVPPALGTAIAGLAAQPVLTLRTLPFPARLESAQTHPGRLVVTAAVGPAP